MDIFKGRRWVAFMDGARAREMDFDSVIGRGNTKDGALMALREKIGHTAYQDAFDLDNHRGRLLR